MGNTFSASPSDGQPPKQEVPLKGDEPVITGMGTEWPPKLLNPDDLKDYALKFYPENPPWLKAFLKINAHTGIENRAVVDLWDDPRWHGELSPPTEEVDSGFREYSVQLSKNAALKALRESNIDPSAITHMVSVTVTNGGAPGFDQLVARELGLSPTTERILLSGVGCAGGCAALRVASTLAAAATYRKQEARILVVACELCSIHLRGELHAASLAEMTTIAPALFSDGASAFVLCNPLGMSDKTPKQFAVVDQRTGVTPGTLDEMSYKVTTHGFLATISKSIPKLAVASIQAPFQSLIQSNGMSSASPTDFHWALHPGGRAVIQGAQDALNLPDDALAASNEIYRTRGNTSSVAVLAVLDKVRELKLPTSNVIACSFGPGLTTEMALLRRMV
ncbi:t3pks [Aspergillus niger]|nr:t3pks [Aspergillus niger]